MAIVAVGLNHKSAPLKVLERLAFPPPTLPKSLARLVDHDPIHEGVILSTCNRTEVYATVHRFHPAVQAVRRFLSDVSGVGEHEISSGLYTYYDSTAVRHLFSVASGIDSMVLGEPQILGQVREAYLAAQEQGSARRLLASLLQRSLRVGKRVRTETAIARHVVSLPQVAARVAAELSGGAEGRRAIVVGAGRMGELAARAALDLGCRELRICNRDAERAGALGARLGAGWAGLDELPRLLADTDIVVCATSATEPVLERDALVRASIGRDRPLVVVDLGVPRNVDPACRELDGIVLRDIDDLQEVADAAAQRRRAEVPKAEAIVEAEVEAFCVWQRSLALGPAIEALRTRVEAIRAAEVDRVARRRGSDADREALDALTRSVVNKLLHLPITRMKDLVAAPDGQVYLETFRELFDLDAPED